jgi:hypothetical protein
VTSAIKMGKDTRHGRIAAFTACYFYVFYAGH